MEELGMNEVFKHSVKNYSDEGISMSVTYSGHEKCSSGQRWGKGIRQQYILHLVVSGKGIYNTPDSSFELSAGDIFLIRPYTEIEYYANENDPWEYLWVNFTGTDAEGLLKRTDFTPECPVIRSCSEEIRNAMADIVSNAGTTRYEATALTGRLYILLSMLMKHSHRKNSRPARESEKRHIIKAAKDFVATNYPVSVSVEDIAAAANVSRTTLFRIFKSELNTTPVDYLTAYRIAQAKTLLTETELSITAVARSSGYEDNLYFSRVFRKITGFTPTEYRNCNKNPYE